MPKYTKLIFQGSFPTREHRSLEGQQGFTYKTCFRTKTAIQSDFLGHPDSEAPSRQTSDSDNFKSPDTVYTPHFILTRHSFESRRWSREKLQDAAPESDLQDAQARDCADNMLSLNEKLKTDVRTVDLAAKQIQTVLCSAITRTAPESEYNTAYLHTQTAEQIMSQAMHLNNLGHNIRMLNMKFGITYVK